MDAKPLKWAEVREHYWKQPGRNGTLARYLCVNCEKIITIYSHQVAGEVLRDHLTEQHADKLKQGE